MLQANNDFEKIKLNAEMLYKTLDQVYCPFFKEKIIFNSLGLDHLKFKRHDKNRFEPDQYMRFKLLHLAPHVLSLSHTLQGFKEVKKFERVRKNSRTEMVLQLVSYYQFIAIIKKDRVKIIVKQVENGPKFFWSIIPFWKIKNNRRFFFEENHEED